MKRNVICFLIFLLISNVVYSQENRIDKIKTTLEELSIEVPGLSQKINVSIKEADLPSFLIAVSEVHNVNMNVAPNLKQILIANNFSDVIVSDLLLFLCKEYNLTIEFTGNILSIKSFEKPREIPAIKEINAAYQIDNGLLSLDLKDDKLYEVFKKIMDVSGKNLVFSPGLENKLLTSYIKNVPFEDALSKLAYGNNLFVEKSKDNFYLFESALETDATIGNTGSITSQRPSKPNRQRKSNFFFNITDRNQKMLEVDFENTPVANIIYDIGHELGIDMFISSPLDGAGNATVKAKQISFDELLRKIFESNTNSNSSNNPAPQNLQNNANNINSQNNTRSELYSFLVKDDVYFFGLKNQLTIRKIKSIQLMHRSIEILSDPNKEGRSVGRLNNQNNFSNFNQNFNQNQNTFDNRSSSTQINQNSNNTQAASESILKLIPNEIVEGLDIKIDTELNSFIVSGPGENIDRFQSFIQYIDKPIPVILIEVMILEVSRSAVLETGISAGIGDKPANTIGSVFTNPDITLGSQTINNIINRFDGFGSLNIGNVVPNFYLSIKALESNGNLKIRSSPRLSTLNGHRAFLSIGETTYYVVTNQNFIGSQIPQTSEIRNYQPIDAELSLTIKPLVSGDGQITMDIKVIQSSFNGQRVDEDAPPGINSREFTSIIRVKDQDIIVLGGLEEKVKNDSGSGIPILARIPVIKWFFSSRKREDSSSKLTVIIKPTVIE
jgi:type IV pilus assembly protein PilQ